MPKILNFKTEHGNFLIEMLDNEFVDQWLQHFLRVTKKYHTSIRPNRWPWIETQLDSKKDQVNQAIDQVVVATQLIDSLDGIAPLPEKICREQLASLDLNTQHVLNRLHRYAVVATENRDRWVQDQPASFEWVPYDHAQFDYAVNLLNQNIHNLEMYVSTPHKKKFWGAWYSTEIVFDASKYTDVDIYHDDVDVAISDDMFPHLRLTGYDVWIKKDLLGKDFITAFADHDDPSKFDIRPPTIYSGGIHINQNTGKDTIYHSEEFVNWLGTTPTDFHGNYPLGRVIENKQHTVKAQQVEFVELITQ